MHCPFCNSAESKVLDSRPGQDAKSIRRRRECLHCQKRWRTCERLEDEMPVVLKKNQTHQPFEREKLLTSIKVACGKRPVTMGQIESAVADVEWNILEQGGKTVSTVEIGEWVMTSLKEIDEIAYVRYASVYRRFKDVTEFMTELEHIIRTPPPEATLAEKNLGEAPRAPAKRNDVPSA